MSKGGLAGLLAQFSGTDVAGSIEKVADTFNDLNVSLTAFSDVANGANDNYTNLLNGLIKFGDTVGQVDKVVTGLFGTSSKLGVSLSAVLKPMRLISQGVGAFAQTQSAFAELAGATDSLSAGIRETYSEFHVLTNTFGGTYEEAQRLSVLFTDLQKKSGSEEFGFVSRKELMDVANAMETNNLEISRMSEIIPSAGRDMDLLTTAVLQADALSMSASEHMGYLSSAIMKTGLSSNEAFKQMAGFNEVADKTGMSTAKIASGLQSAVNNFQQLGLSADFAKPLMLGFADSLSGVGIGIENAIGLSQALTKSLAGLGEDYGMAHLVSQLGGLDYGQGGSALSSGIGIQKAMLDAESTGDFESLGAELADGMKTMLEGFGGGEIVTVTDAANDPSKASAFYVQQQMLSNQFSMSQSEATRTLEMLQQLDDANASGDSETAKRLREQIADQKAGRNDTISLMEKQNVHTAGIFAHAQMQTRMQSMMLRDELGGGMLDQMRAEADEMGKAFMDASREGLRPEYIKNAARALEEGLQGGLRGRGEGANEKATLTESAREAVVDEVVPAMEDVNWDDAADAFKQFFKDLEATIWNSSKISAPSTGSNAPPVVTP